nr:2-C-methyl-D-erythritol 4-phosphate cytidylyltransferase [Pseudopedobacter sp.]
MEKEVYSYYAIIVAGGKGKRMHHDLPKQFIPINGLPILMHSINAFHQNEFKPEIILVLAEVDLKVWQNLINQYQFDIPHQIAFGGAERFHSVKNGFSKIDVQNSIIAIHDAVRPLVSQKTISNCFKTALTKGNAIAAIPSKDSLRSLKDGLSVSLNRSETYLVQTPQTFQYSQLKKAYEQEFSINFTDDASVVEKAGFPILLEAGDQFNFKITFPEDLIIAEILLKSDT